jgi:phosphatidylserine decarboxylase
MLIGSAVLALVAFALAEFVFWPLALLLLPILIFLFAFFRDPERQVPTDQDVMVSPADGTISDITRLEHDELLGGPAIRVGIFLSVFNVHINRGPCDGVVLLTQYKKGKFMNAMRHQLASDENESNTILLGEPTTKKPIAVVRQIVGLIARRIIFTAETGELLRRGQRIGMIKFGSRTELTVPTWLDPHVKVEVGQSVRGAADVIFRLGKPIHTTATVPPDVHEFERTAPRETPA